MPLLDKQGQPLELPDIGTFVADPRYVGHPQRRPYPGQLTLLRTIHLDVEHMTPHDHARLQGWMGSWEGGSHQFGVPPDTYRRIELLRERGYPHFRIVLFIGGRRSGKGLVGAWLSAYEVFRLLCLGNPQVAFGLDPTKDLELLVAATAQHQARRHQFRDIHRVIEEGACFEPYFVGRKGDEVRLWTPADLERTARGGDTSAAERSPGSIRVRAVSANAASVRGAAAFMEIFDEAAHAVSGTEGPGSSEEVWHAMIPSMDQMGVFGLAYLPTTPAHKIGQPWRLFEQAHETDGAGELLHPEILPIVLSSWMPYLGFDDPILTGGRPFVSAPVVDGPVLRTEEGLNPAKFRVERLAQFANLQNPYLDPGVVESMFEPFLGRQLAPQTRGQLRWRYRAHVDTSKSQKNTTLVIAHTEPVPDETGETWWHVIVDLLRVWSPRDFPRLADDTVRIDYVAIEREIVQIVKSFPTLGVVTFDDYGAFSTITHLREALRKTVRHPPRVAEERFGHQDNSIRCERFKTALYQGWIHSFRDAFGSGGESLLEAEAKFVEERNGRLVPQSSGPCQTKDLLDGVMVCAAELLADQLDRLGGVGRREIRLAAGAPGGYHTPGGFGPPAVGSIRSRLDSFSSSLRSGGTHAADLLRYQRR